MNIFRKNLSFNNPLDLKTLTCLFIYFNILCLSVYFKALSGGFMLDDHYFYEYQFNHFDYKDPALVLYFRPTAIAFLSFWYLIFQNQTFYLHLANALTWATAVVCIFIFLDILKVSRLVNLIATSLYLIHPLNGIVIQNIGSGYFALNVIFISMGVWIILRLKKMQWMAMILLLLSLFNHETNGLFPFYLLFILLIVEGKSRFESFKIAGPYFFIVIGIAVLRFIYARFTPTVIPDQSQHLNVNILDFIATQSKLLFWYISQFIYPKNVVFIKALPLSSVNAWLWVSVLFAFVIILIFLSRIKNLDRDIKLGGGIFIIGLLPFPISHFLQLTGILQNAHGLIIEPHWFIFPSIGMFLIISKLLCWMLNYHRLRWLGAFCIIVIFGFIIKIDQKYNFLWADEERYAQYWLKESPTMPSVAYHLGLINVKKGIYNQAILYFQQAATNSYYKTKGQTQLLKIYFKIKDYKPAKQILLEMYNKNPNNWEILNNLGSVLFSLKEYIAAEGYLRKAIELNPQSAVAQRNLAKVLQKLYPPIDNNNALMLP